MPTYKKNKSLRSIANQNNIKWSNKTKKIKKTKRKQSQRLKK
jgi:hypothetical protein